MLSAVGLFALFVIASYSARKSYIAIVKLRKYEERSEQAAKRFDTAAHELYKTRATQASSAAAVCTSFLPVTYTPPHLRTTEALATVKNTRSGETAVMLTW